MNKQLAGRTVLVTGASSGLGAHIAQLFAVAGANLVIGARRVEQVTLLAENLASQGSKVLSVKLDVTDERSVMSAFDFAEAELGTVDTVVANAGVSRPGRSIDIPEEDIRAVCDTNLMGVYLTAREGARRMIAADFKQSHRGRIILIGSITAHQTSPGNSIYAATKAAVAHLGRNMAREWVRQGINVNTIHPGYIQTELAGGYFETQRGKDMIASFPLQRLQPIGSLDGQLLYLASDASISVTGAVIDIDEGQSL